MKSILDRSFRYIPSYETDLAKKFASLRKEYRKLVPKSSLDGAKVISINQPLTGKQLFSEKTV